MPQITINELTFAYEQSAEFRDGERYTYSASISLMENSFPCVKKVSPLWQ